VFVRVDGWVSTLEFLCLKERHQSTRADCVVVGAGPGGLTAAVYLARYLRDVVVLDDGRSRALWIPLAQLPRLS
jgi:choline dehydrogenase-like flavoprotein